MRGVALAKVYLICGKICSGKSYYANKLKHNINAIVFSCDEVINDIFPYPLGEAHDEIVARIKQYLFNKSLELVGVGVDVILDFGFWSERERNCVSEFFKKHNVLIECHYIDISDNDWKRNIKERNDLVLLGKSKDFFVDDGLLKKLDSLFETPSRDEIDCWHINSRL